MENIQPTTTLPAIQVETLLQVFKEIPPVKELTTKLQTSQSACLEMLQDLKKPENDQQYEENNEILSVVREQHGKMLALRSTITKQTDEFKDYLMQFEREFNPSATKDNQYLLKRKLQEEYKQEQLDRVNREKQEAAKRKELENHKIDLRAKMLENLTNMVTASVKRVDNGSKDFFDKSTLQDWDERATQYRNNKPKLKQTDYDACFNCAPILSLISQDNYALYVTEVQQEQTYEMWNTKFVEAISPVINDWRARIDDLKKAKEELFEATFRDKEEGERLAKEQKARADEEQLARQKKMDAEAEAKKVEINKEADLDKMSNNFAEQAATQDLEGGAVKLVLKFVNPKTTPKALFAIMYHVFSHPDFPGIQRRDAKKKLMFDDKQRPIYVEEVQKWIDFFLKNCDASIEGTVVYEDAKITIRK